jgi:putative transposase
VLDSCAGPNSGRGRITPGYADPKRCYPWVAHDALLASWQGDWGGPDPAAAYRKYVEAGLGTAVPSPFREAFGGWILGSTAFVAQLRRLAGPAVADPPPPEAKPLAALDANDLCEAVLCHYGLEPDDLARRGDSHLARAIAARLCRRHTEEPLRALAKRFGLSRADSVPNLTRRIDARLRSSPGFARELERILRRCRRQTKNKG